MTQCYMSTTWAKAMFAVVVANFSFLVFFTMFAFFFFSTYLWSARKDFSHASSAHCHQEISDLKVMFLNNMDLESRQKFSLSHYNWMLILIPFKPRRLVFLVFSVRTVAYSLQTPGEGGGVLDQYLGLRWAILQTIQLLSDALTFA